MSDLRDFESKIAQFVLRTGAYSVERLDLSDDHIPDNTDSKYNIDMKLQTAANALRVDVELTASDENATYRAIMSGQWFSEEDDAFSQATFEENAVLEELMMSILAPQVLSAAQAKIADLARSVDCPPFTLPYNLYTQLRDVRPMTEETTPAVGD